jgi:hypothetical protein|tara:strand:+ start:1169 stop:1603 length:435 start_codon:yes stop_codon:yes gene_type:complete
MRLEDIKNSVEADIAIDHTELDKEAIKTPQLHNKYLIILTDEKLVLAKHNNDYSKLRKYKWLYYTGKISQEELEEFGWEPFSLHILKQDVDKFMDSDDAIIEARSRIELQKRKVQYLEDIIKMIVNRQWLIREAIDWIKFTNGT